MHAPPSLEPTGPRSGRPTRSNASTPGPKRRTRVVGIFPNGASALRLITAVCVETHEEWLVAEKRSMSEGSMALLAPTASAPELEVTLATT